MSLLKQTANSKKSYKTIKFDFNGGTCSESERVVQVGLPLGILPTITKQYKDFDAWYDALDGGNKISATYIVSVNKTIYAHFKDIVRTVSFNANGHGTPSYSSKSIIYGNTFGDLPTISDPSGNYIFTGWYLGGTKITSSTQVTTTTNITLTAGWVGRNITVTLCSYNWCKFAGMSAGASKVVTVHYGDLLDPVLDTQIIMTSNIPITGKYHVWGWSKISPTEDATTGKINNISDYSPSGGIIMYKGTVATENLTLYPIVEGVTQIKFYMYDSTKYAVSPAPNANAKFFAKITIPKRAYYPNGDGGDYFAQDRVINNPTTGQIIEVPNTSSIILTINSVYYTNRTVSYTGLSSSKVTFAKGLTTVKIPTPYGLDCSTVANIPIYYQAWANVPHSLEFRYNWSTSTAGASTDGWIKQNSKCALTMS